ncbi:hypothetical protein RCC89_13095 [Cytophagaceae bacterium ABcell3]|nr:hypothetical protein RCC89_13095 [Cytophagaceae bacterium ABcell3]
MNRLFIFLLICIHFQSLGQHKIKLTEDMVTNLSSWGNAQMLVDEQEKVGDPAAGKEGEHPENRWFPGWKDWYYPASAVIDLKAEYHISDIYFWGGQGTGLVSAYAGHPGDWKHLFDDPLNRYLKWMKHPVGETTRYIKIQINKPGSVPDEIVVYGTKVGEEIPEPSPTKHPRFKIKDFAGINGFVDDPMDVSNVCHFIREYHNWDWNEAEEGKIKFNPSYPGWKFDEYYKNMKDANILVVPCLKQSVKWIADHKEHKPVKGGLDPENPFSYKEKASYMYQYAARYGNKKIDKSKLKLAEGQQPQTGLGLLKYYEDWNEQNQWWNGRKAYFTPFEYASMASANYDGHKGALGKTYGIKAADPDAIHVMGGLAGLDLDYIKAIKLWADYNRDGDFPSDVINVHHYSNDVGGQGDASIGVSPEEDGLKKRLKPIVDYRDRYLPGKEVWLTEFGYDINQKSIQRAPAIGSFSPEEVQAIWLIRSYLEIAAAGVDRAAMYMVRDAPALSKTTRFATSGLTEGKNERKRPSWYYLKSFVHILGSYTFDKEINNKDGINCYRFVEEETGNAIYVLWSPTSTQKEVKGYNFEIPEGKKQYEVMTLINQSERGKTLLKSGTPKPTAVLDISEKPIFIRVFE